MNSTERLNVSRARLRAGVKADIENFALHKDSRGSLASKSIKVLSILAGCVTLFTALKLFNAPLWMRRNFASTSAGMAGDSHFYKPWMAVLAAAAAGVATVWLRPWRSIAKIEQVAAIFIQPCIDVVTTPSLRSWSHLVSTAIGFFNSKPDLKKS